MTEELNIFSYHSLTILFKEFCLRKLQNQQVKCKNNFLNFLKTQNLNHEWYLTSILFFFFLLDFEKAN